MWKRGEGSRKEGEEEILAAFSKTLIDAANTMSKCSRPVSR